MDHSILFDNGEHTNIVLSPHKSTKFSIDTNQYLIIHKDTAVLLDPGGHKIFNQMLPDIYALLAGRAKLKHIIFSHQDPDVVAAIHKWLMTFSKSSAHISQLWMPFISHFGININDEDRIKSIPYSGKILEVDDCKFSIIPAHFLYSAGNFQFYDPIAKILYTGDFGSSMDQPYTQVENFEEHIQYMEKYHHKYMVSKRAFLMWVDMIKGLDIEMIAPQHGAYFKGKEMVDKFINWIVNFECCLDTVDEYKIPTETI